jgi:signal transduction histidine kinase
VVVKLLANAVRHVSLGGILLSLEHVRRRRCWNVITVSDTGTGMDHAVLERVCRPEEHEVAAGGPGLGLRICRLIAAAHGGFLEIGSRPGEGTTVRVFLRADLARMRSGGAARAIRIRDPRPDGGCW